LHPNLQGHNFRSGGVIQERARKLAPILFYRLKNTIAAGQSDQSSFSSIVLDMSEKYSS
jgi:hypothetical protein